MLFRSSSCIRSTVFALDDKFVVAKLTKANDEGTATLESVRAQVEAEVIKAKKGELLAERLKGAKSSGSTSAMASSLGVEAKTVSSVAFANSFIPNLGNEPKVMGVAASLAAGQLSEPVIGTNGVYVMSVTSAPAPLEANETLRTDVSTGIASKADYQLNEALKKTADVEDNRGSFY